MDWIGWALGVLGIVLAVPIGIWIGRRNRQKPDLRVVHDFAQVVRPADWLITGGLTISYDGESIEQVSRTFIALWDHRGDTVQGSDEVESDPLRIQVDDDDAILQVRLVSFSRPQLGVKFHDAGEGDEEGRRITFDFLDEGDGFVVEVLHKGTSPAMLLGTIKGATLKERDVRLNRTSRALLRMPLWKRLVFPVLMRFNVILVGVMIALVAATAVLFFTTFTPGTPRVISVNEFDLTTLEGQSDFASEVRREGLDPNSGFVQALFLGPVVLIIPMVLILLLPARSIIPRSVLAFDLDPASEHDMRTARYSQVLPNSNQVLRIRKGSSTRRL